MLQIIFAILALSETREDSPAAVASLLGTLQWLDLLQRFKLSVLPNAYEFAADAKD